MKELLISKGFTLKQYSDGLFWVWVSKGTNVMDYDHTTYQCTESFRDFTMCLGGWVYEFTEEEFLKAIEEVS